VLRKNVQRKPQQRYWTQQRRRTQQQRPGQQRRCIKQPALRTATAALLQDYRNRAANYRTVPYRTIPCIKKKFYTEKGRNLLSYGTGRINSKTRVRRWIEIKVSYKLQATVLGWIKNVAHSCCNLFKDKYRNGTVGPYTAEVFKLCIKWIHAQQRRESTWAYGGSF
jgi:hypothetical protein